MKRNKVILLYTLCVLLGGVLVGPRVKAEDLLLKIPNSYMPQQFKNPANPQMHRETTAQEILKQTEGRIDAFVAGVGTGGTITGVGEVLKEYNPNIRIFAVEPIYKTGILALTL